MQKQRDDYIPGRDDRSICMPDSSQLIHIRGSMLLYFYGKGGEQNRENKNAGVNRQRDRDF